MKRSFNKPLLSPAQWKALEELAEPNSNENNEWRMPPKMHRTLVILVGKAMVKAEHYGDSVVVWYITDFGRHILKNRAQYDR